MQQYLDLLRDVRTNGHYKLDRTKVGCYSVFGRQMRFDLSKGLPAVTTKKLFFRGLIEELLWIIRGSTNNEELVAKNVHIWDEWALAEDETREVQLLNHERIVLRAEKFGITVQESQQRAEHDDYLVRQMGERPSSRYGGEPNGGEKVLDDEGIPRTKAVVVRPKGDLGPIYGKQWRAWEGVDGRIHDQLENAIALLEKDPASRRNVVSAWNVGELDQMSLNPCHAFFQFYAEELTYRDRVDLYIKKVYPMLSSDANYAEIAGQYPDDVLLELMVKFDIGFGSMINVGTSKELEAELGVYRDRIFEILATHQIPEHRLSCQLYQRSADIFLGVPFNITSYALLTYMVAQVVNMAPGEFVHTFGDLHVYANHLEQVDLQLTREPKPLPQVRLNPKITSIDDFTIEDIQIEGYESWPAIKGEVAV